MFTQCVFFTVNAAARELSKRWDEAFRPLGLTAAQAYTLVLIIRNPNLKLKEICKEILLEPSSASRNLARLERIKLIARTIDPNDSRAVRFYATKKGIGLEAEIVSTSRSVRANLYRETPQSLFDELSKLSVRWLTSSSGGI